MKATHIYIMILFSQNITCFARSESDSYPCNYLSDGITQIFNVAFGWNSQASTIGSGPDESGALVLALLDG